MIEHPPYLFYKEVGFKNLFIHEKFLRILTNLKQYDFNQCRFRKNSDHRR